MLKSLDLLLFFLPLMGSTHGLLFVLIYCLGLIEGEIRCYCNESGCVQTGYMCKSTLNACYSILTYDGEKPKTTQGCIETLQPSQRVVCKSEKPEQYTSKLPTQEQSLLICCDNDMCNYNEKTISIIVKEKSNGSTQNGNGKVEDIAFLHKTSGDQNPDKDLWFKAAVIAVPIAGGFILILLVLLAVRMLRSDSRRHRQLIQIRRERTSLTKAQLYVTDHFCDKPCTKKPPLLFDEKHNIVCKDPVIKMNKDGKIYEKVLDASNSNNRNKPSLIVWGNPGKKDFATIV